MVRSGEKHLLVDACDASGDVPVFRVETLIDAPARVCFDVARDVAVHTQSAA